MFSACYHQVNQIATDITATTHIRLMRTTISAFYNVLYAPHFWGNYMQFFLVNDKDHFNESKTGRSCLRRNNLFNYV